jgi:DNA mismatch repair protein MutS2
VQAVTKPIERAIDYLPTDERPVRASDQAEHRKFKVKGKVLSVDGKRAVLDVNGRKMTVETRDLVSTGASQSATSPTGRRSAVTGFTADVATVPIGAELNLIGQRVDDGIDEIDRFLDRSLLEGKQAVRIIHGFGTGVLRKAVREHLRKHPAARSWRPGDDNEGGDGATVVVLDS